MNRDYSSWLTPHRLAVEEALWAECKFYERYADGIRRLIKEHPSIEHVVELGCGTGWVPTTLGEDSPLLYDLVDLNEDCLKLAVEKNAQQVNSGRVRIVHADMRNMSPACDLACSFAVLKHLPLADWNLVFARLFCSARFALFTVPIAAACVDDGIEFTHVRVSEEYLAYAVFAAGHAELWRDSTDPDEPMIATARIR